MPEDRCDGASCFKSGRAAAELPRPRPYVRGKCRRRSAVGILLRSRKIAAGLESIFLFLRSLINWCHTVVLGFSLEFIRVILNDAVSASVSIVTASV